MKYEVDIEKIIEAAQAGGEIVAGYFGEILEIEEKSMLADVRTKADTESESAVIKSLQKSFPDYAIHSEEVGHNGLDSEYLFVIDPLDGTQNFVSGFPQFSVSIALMHKGETIAGVVYHPILKKAYHAVKGEGAYLSGTKLHVNNENRIERITVTHMCGYTTYKSIFSLWNQLLRAPFKRIMQNWSPALDYCLLADGKIESIINAGAQLYDYAAGRLIAHEAGALSTDFRGNKLKTEDQNHFLTSNHPEIHKTVLEIVKKAEL